MVVLHTWAEAVGMNLFSPCGPLEKFAHPVLEDHLWQ